MRYASPTKRRCKANGWLHAKPTLGRLPETSQNIHASTARTMFLVALSHRFGVARAEFQEVEMQNPESIAHRAIVKALGQLRKERDIPAHRESAKYDLIYRGKRYPPKYVLSRANEFIPPGHERLRPFRGGRLTNGFLESSGFKIVPKSAATAEGTRGERRFWVVSPNVTNNNRAIELWKKAIKAHRAAFMGWRPDDPKHRLGAIFADDISKGDVILIARRFNNKPDVVGYGVVSADESVKNLKGFTAPDTKWRDGTIRQLSRFVFDNAIPTESSIMSVVNHRQSLCQLHPNRNPDHRRVCDWLTERLRRSVGNNGHRGRVLKPRVIKQDIRRKPHTDPAQFDFSQLSAEAVRKARKLEAALVRDYKKWLGDKHVVNQIAFGRFECDAHEEDRNNLIEAKASIRREYIRMAVGQLLDYSFLGKEFFGTPHKAILLPKKPVQEIVEWLDSLEISVIWKKGNEFHDSAGGQFI